MNPEENILKFTLVHRGTEYPVRTCNRQYYSLMSLISDCLAIPGFGLCSGMGSCGTCLVDISENKSSVKRLALSCDVQVNNELENVMITISVP